MAVVVGGSFFDDGEEVIGLDGLGGGHLGKLMAEFSNLVRKVGFFNNLMPGPIFWLSLWVLLVGMALRLALLGDDDSSASVTFLPGS